MNTSEFYIRILIRTYGINNNFTRWVLKRFLLEQKLIKKIWTKYNTIIIRLNALYKEFAKHSLSQSIIWYIHCTIHNLLFLYSVQLFTPELNSTQFIYIRDEYKFVNNSIWQSSLRDLLRQYTLLVSNKIFTAQNSCSEPIKRALKVDEIFWWKRGGRKTRRNVLFSLQNLLTYYFLSAISIPE